MQDFRLWTRIAEAIRSDPGIPRAELAQIVGMSPATITRAVQAMLEAHVVEEARRPRVQGSGRSRVGLQVNAEIGYALALDVKVRSAVAALVDFTGAVICRQELTMSMADVSVAMTVLPEFVAHVLAERSSSTDRLWGVGVSIPGTWSASQRTLVFSPSLPRWRGVNLQSLFSALSARAFVVENNTRAAAIAELTLGAARRFRDFLYVYGDFGVGSTFVHQREIVRGLDNLASGLGHTLMSLDGPVCEVCGRAGCIAPLLNTGAIRRRIASGEPTEVVLRDTARILSVPIANLLNLFCPQALLVGGHLFQAWSALYPLLVEATQAHLLPHIVHRVAFVPAEFGNEATLVGIAMRVFAHPPGRVLASELAQLVH